MLLILFKRQKEGDQSINHNIIRNLKFIFYVKKKIHLFKSQLTFNKQPPPSISNLFTNINKQSYLIR